MTILVIIWIYFKNSHLFSKIYIQYILEILKLLRNILTECSFGTICIFCIYTGSQLALYLWYCMHILYTGSQLTFYFITDKKTCSCFSGKRTHPDRQYAKSSGVEFKQTTIDHQGMNKDNDRTVQAWTVYITSMWEKRVNTISIKF